MIDCHTHLTSREFDADRAAVLERAWAAGVTHIALMGQDAAENAAVLRAAGPAPPGTGRPALLAFAGLHPDRFGDGRVPPTEAEIEALCAEARRARASLTGIGEVGLDHWRCKEEPLRAQQRAAFERLIVLALELDLPLNVHSRSAGRLTIELLLERGARRVLLHAFDGKAGHAPAGAEAGFVFSIPPSIVRSEQKQKLVRALPLEALALETDSPVLGPEPGTRNEPANVAVSVAAIARIKGVSEEEVRIATTATARRLLCLGSGGLGSGGLGSGGLDAGEPDRRGLATGDREAAARKEAP
jgi:TatD DNase family protein